MIMPMSIEVVYTAESTATGGGRDGHVKSIDGRIDLEAVIDQLGDPGRERRRSVYGDAGVGQPRSPDDGTLSQQYLSGDQSK